MKECQAIELCGTKDLEGKNAYNVCMCLSVYRFPVGRRVWKITQPTAGKVQRNSIQRNYAKNKITE